MAWYTWAGWLLYVSSVVYGLCRGGGPEKAAAALIGAAAIATIGVRTEWGARYLHVEYGVMWVDVSLFAGLAMTAMYARRTWPVVCSTFAGLTAAGHIARALDVNVSTTAYMLVSVFSAYTMPIALIWGTRLHRRRMAKRGVDASWNVSSPGMLPTLSKRPTN